MIETFKILTGKYDMRATPTTLVGSSSVTRGHNLRLNKFRVKYDLRKYYFTTRIVNVCRGVNPYGTEGTRPPIYLGWGGLQ